MVLTRTHALYYAARKLPAALRQHAQDVTIDQCVNAHVDKKRPIAVSEPHNTIHVLLLIRKREGMGGVRRKVHEWANYGWPGLGKPDDLGRYMQIDRRYAYAIKWAAKLAPADWDADPAVQRENEKFDSILKKMREDHGNQQP
jgi:hypothetical protein